MLLWVVVIARTVDGDVGDEEEEGRDKDGRVEVRVMVVAGVLPPPPPPPSNWLTRFADAETHKRSEHP